MGSPPMGLKGKGKAPLKSPAPVSGSGGIPSKVIPHQPRDDYHRRIEPYSTDYYCWEGTWKYHKGRAQGSAKDVCLVEVWDRGGGKIEIHPSRNPFFLARHPAQDWLWYAAMQHFMRTIMLKARGGQVTAQDRDDAMKKVPRLQMGTPQGTTGTARPTGARPGAAGPSSPRAAAAVSRFGKDSSTRVPDWARNFENIIGYTSGGKIQWDDYPNDPILTATYNKKEVITIPSVYFFGGHLTTDHNEAENVGFSLDDPGTCLFFGNVLKAYV